MAQATRVRIELTIQFDPESESELIQVSEQLAQGMTASELTALWDLVDRAIRHPAHFEKVRREVERRQHAIRV